MLAARNMTLSVASRPVTSVTFVTSPLLSKCRARSLHRPARWRLAPSIVCWECGAQFRSLQPASVSHRCGIFQDWSQWSPCSMTCGKGGRPQRRAAPQQASRAASCLSGSQTRLRGIRNGPAYGGKVRPWCPAPWSPPCLLKENGCGEECDPKRNETVPCDLGICPVDCQPRPRGEEQRAEKSGASSRLAVRWSLWDAWSACSRSCNGGTYTRQRAEQAARTHAAPGSARQNSGGGSGGTWRPLLLGIRRRRRRLQRARPHRQSSQCQCRLSSMPS